MLDADASSTGPPYRVDRLLAAEHARDIGGTLGLQLVERFD
jgi:hypothetical protein